MVKKKVTVKNSAGLHTRPAAVLVQLASEFEAEFHIHMYGYRINGKSILGVMTLAADEGSEMELEFDGPDEQEALDAVVKLFDDEFEDKA
ncbi:MAG: HPr family phosphocarrier protein [Bacteroidetes bacterium]|nr:HPr family phosphocarrier protein [Bacteroidota bacterium]MCH8523559.1 HPr family phosphocarrier protein [Balneolales bacterium]